MEGKLRSASPLNSRCCIFKVPDVLRRHNDKAYKPDIVSIGPFHRGSGFQDMEKVKQWYLHTLLSDKPASTLNVSLKSLIKGVRELEKRARECYSEAIDHLTADEFLEMMIVDGCFIIELFRKEAGIVPRDRDDPVFNMPCMHEYLYHDLLLLENQLPWFVLQCLFNLTMEIEQRNFSLGELTFHFFKCLFPTMNAGLRPNAMFEALHILDLIRNMLIAPFGNKEPEHFQKYELIPCVTNLLEAGIRFEKGSPDSMLEVKFYDGVMTIPPLLIHEETEPLFRNLIAFEQCYHGCLDKITSYAIFIDSLINSREDVNFLKDKGIIDNWLSPEDASQFFTSLYNDTFVTKFYYGKLCEQVNGYYRTEWHKWTATLKRDYFRNPWSIISLVAGVILLGLTVAQTIFSILK